MKWKHAVLWSALALLVLAGLVLAFGMRDPGPPFQFLAGRKPLAADQEKPPFFKDPSRQYYLYTFKGDFRPLLTAMRKELKAEGFREDWNSPQGWIEFSRPGVGNAWPDGVTIWRDTVFRLNDDRFPDGAGPEDQMGWVTIDVDLPKETEGLWQRFVKFLGL